MQKKRRQTFKPPFKREVLEPCRQGDRSIGQVSCAGNRRRWCMAPVDANWASDGRCPPRQDVRSFAHSRPPQEPDHTQAQDRVPREELACLGVGAYPPRGRSVPWPPASGDHDRVGLRPTKLQHPVEHRTGRRSISHLPFVRPRPQSSIECPFVPPDGVLGPRLLVVADVLRPLPSTVALNRHHRRSGTTTRGPGLAARTSS